MKLKGNTMGNEVLREINKTNKVLEILSPIINLIPDSIAYTVFNDRFIRSERSLGINAKMVAFKKAFSAEKKWDWYIHF